MSSIEAANEFKPLPLHFAMELIGSSPTTATGYVLDQAGHLDNNEVSRSQSYSIKFSKTIFKELVTSASRNDDISVIFETPSEFAMLLCVA